MSALAMTPPDQPAVYARPDSVPVGVVEHRIWQPHGKLARQLSGGADADRGAPTKKEAWQFQDAVISAAERLDYLTKTTGKRMGEIGDSGIKVLKALFFFADKMTGRMDPSITAIAAYANLARQTVCDAMKRLRDAGFLSWIRRKVETGNQGAGPQIHQATNAIWFKLRGRAAGLVRLALAKLKAPPPDDDTARRKWAAAEVEMMLDSGTNEEAARYIAGADDPLGEALARLGRAMDSSASSATRRNPDGEVKE